MIDGKVRPNRAVRLKPAAGDICEIASRILNRSPWTTGALESGVITTVQAQLIQEPLAR